MLTEHNRKQKLEAIDRQIRTVGNVHGDDGRWLLKEVERLEFPEHVHKAFEAALVSCMAYFRGVWDDKEQEIAALNKRIGECEAEITHLKTTRLGREMTDE